MKSTVKINNENNNNNNNNNDDDDNKLLTTIVMNGSLACNAVQQKTFRFIIS